VTVTVRVTVRVMFISIRLSRARGRLLSLEDE
jgi:hypothetical protein